jgi:HPt (histidine-containing phosphotransfer) domain-containing protein
VSGARELFLQSGMNDFLAKPIEANELNWILSTWLPPEKIMKTMHNTEQANESDAFLPLLMALSGIPELDTAAGLSHIGGSLPAYIGILRQFCAEFDGYLEEIRRFLAEANWKEYTIRLHAMKGVFANIGVESLREWADKLELAGKNQEIDICLAETEAICNAMAQFRDKLVATGLLAGTEKAKHSVSGEWVREKLAALKDACTIGDSSAADEVAAELETAHVDDATDKMLGEIVKAVAALEYEAVLEVGL